MKHWASLSVDLLDGPRSMHLSSNRKVNITDLSRCSSIMYAFDFDYSCSASRGILYTCMIMFSMIVQAELHVKLTETRSGCLLSRQGQ
ncbi:unnamed protein product [Brassica rapa]|uniref:Uncharacterized protein n=2 Tax=Brassica TaxID=3705 RepID=A0A8D9HAS2_BRACM|nr:unnamed protein product [Brassica napus]CAG7894819.1 unnamed protein product [Brassica rapa]CAG7899516.1 unnamed protein product [Brassica rapa]